MKRNLFSVIMNAAETSHGSPGGGKPGDLKDLSQLPDVATSDSPVVAATQHVAAEASIAAQMARDEHRESGLKKHETPNHPTTPNPEVTTPIQKVVTTAGKLPSDTPVETSLPTTQQPAKIADAPKRAFFFGIFTGRRFGLPAMVGAAIAVIIMMALFASWTAVPSTHRMKLHQGLSEGGWYSNWQFNRDREKVTTFKQTGYGSASQVEVELQDSKGRTYKPNANGWRETPSSRISRE